MRLGPPGGEGMGKGKRGAWGALLLVFAGGVSAQYVRQIELAVPPGLDVRRVAPGADTNVVLDVTNHGATTREVRLVSLGAHARGWADFQFASGDTCPVAQPAGQPLSIAVGPLGPGERRQCRFTV